MSLRSGTLSLPVILRDVVEPCLARLLRPGELDSVELAWRTVSLPDWPADIDPPMIFGCALTGLSMER